MITALLLAAVFAAGCLAGWLHANGYLLHALAWMRGGQWYVGGQVCPGCGRRVHVMRRGPLTAGLCTACSSGRTHSDGHAGPRLPLSELLGSEQVNGRAEGPDGSPSISAPSSINDERSGND